MLVGKNDGSVMGVGTANRFITDESVIYMEELHDRAASCGYEAGLGIARLHTGGTGRLSAIFPASRRMERQSRFSYLVHKGFACLQRFGKGGCDFWGIMIGVTFYNVTGVKR